jgi:hypothetical protein
MTLYNVHLYREVHLTYESIEADTAEAAAAIAIDQSVGAADDIDDCDGETFVAVIDEAGDDQYQQSVTIDFEGERLRKAAPELLAACQMVVDRWERGDLAEAVRACSVAIAKATEEGRPA